jgi:hypothetical protein
MDHPQVREYLSLIRLQVLTPLSLLISIATLVICGFLVTPSISHVAKINATSISPKISLIAVYLAAIYGLQIGYCVLLVLARKPETKKTLVNGVGLALVFSNWVMAAWAVAFIFRLFLLSAILQGLLIILLVYSNLALLIYHPPTSSRPFDMALIHAPMRFFLILPLSLLFPYSLFVTLGNVYDIVDGTPVNYSDYAWSGFAVVIISNLIGLAVVLYRRDITWCVAATWIAISVWSKRPKPAPVYITVILFTVLHPLALFASFVYHKFYLSRRDTGPIALPEEEGEEGQNRGPREIDPNGWGT